MKAQRHHRRQPTDEIVESAFQAWVNLSNLNLRLNENHKQTKLKRRKQAKGDGIGEIGVI